MSEWTYINGFMNIMFFAGETQTERNRKFKDFVESLPKVTSSEDDMYIMYSPNKAKSYAANYDIEGNRKILYDYFLVAFSGSLRDRTEKETIEEFKSFVHHIANHNDAAIEEMSVIINDTAYTWPDYDDDHLNFNEGHLNEKGD